MTTNNKFSKIIIPVLLFSIMAISSCKKFVELGAPPTQIVLSDVFKTDATATSAVLAMYSTSSGSIVQEVLNFSVLPGSSADDVKLTAPSPMYDEFRVDVITALTNNNNANLLWAPAYQLIKNANDAISGLTASTTLTPSVHDQLLGEAKTFRAWGYFYLVNFYGDVPMPLTDDSHAADNALLPRTPAAQVWAQIISDLKDAQNLLPTNYVGTFRGRINKWAATTLLAKAYLYTKDYANAETQASLVIGSGSYTLQTPANTFINTSNEIIFQVANLTGVSTFGANYLPAPGSIPTYTMYDTLYNSFEPGDQRKTNWTGVTNVGGVNYYYVNKYKARVTSGNEYNVVFRLAELYLIRGEARAQQNNLAGAKADIDVIRLRAGLPVLSALLTQGQMLLAIEQERKVELFGEWGNRWLDLKRTGRVNAVIGGEKPATWQPTAALYPIPGSQILANPNLTQNPGY